MKKILYIVPVSLAVTFALFFYLHYGATGTFPLLKNTLDIIIWSTFSFSIAGYLLVQASSRLDSLFPWRVSFGKRFFLGLLVNLITAFLIIALFGAAFFFISDPGQELTGFFDTFMDEIYKLIILLVFIIFIYTLTDLALYTYNQYAIEQIQEIRTNRELVSLQFEVLKKQLSPHFLFNSLNTASSMLYRDVELTESFIRKLVYSYQKIFSSVKENLISLAGELDIVSAYTYLMEIRFEDAVKVDINIDKNLHDKMIPPLSLQLLVENAIKHNLINDKQPLHVIIFNEKDDYLVVKNNCISRPYYINVENKLVENPNQQSTKVGLKNLQSRYRFFTRKKIFIEKNNDFIVKIPLLTDDQEPNMSNYTEPTNNKEVIF